MRAHICGHFSYAVLVDVYMTVAYSIISVRNFLLCKEFLGMRAFQLCSPSGHVHDYLILLKCKEFSLM